MLRPICLYAVVSQVLVTATCLAALLDYGTRELEWSCDSDRYIADAFRHNLGRYSLPSSTLLVHSVADGDRHFPAHWYVLAEFPSGFHITFRPEVSYPFLQGRNSTYAICTFDPRLGSSMSCDHIGFGHIIRAPTWCCPHARSDLDLSTSTSMLSVVVEAILDRQLPLGR